MILCQRHLFDIPDDIAYLNCAYMSPLMKPALEAGTAGLARKAHPGELRPNIFLQVRKNFARPQRSSMAVRPTASPSFPRPATAS